jgi:hypothetical protein
VPPALLWLVFAFARDGAPPAPPVAELCVAVAADARVLPNSLVAAVRARIPSPVGVRPCEREATLRARFSLELDAPAPDVVRLVVRGDGVSGEQLLPIAGLGDEEIAQRVALTAAEALGPSVDELLRALGLLVEAPVVSSAAPLPEPAAPQSLAPSVGLGGGGRAGGDIVPFARLDGGVALGPLGVRLFVAGARLPGTTTAVAKVSGWDLTFGIGATWRWRVLELTAGMHSRVVVLDVAGSLVPADARRQSFWVGGVGLESVLHVYRVGDFDVALTAALSAWPQPVRFLLAGEEALRQSYFELAVGPRFAFGPASNVEF